MNFMDTVAGSLLENFYPKGWDMAKIDACCDKGVARENFWNKDFNPIACDSLADFDTLMGHEIAMQIKTTRETGQKLAMIRRSARWVCIAGPPISSMSGRFPAITCIRSTWTSGPIRRATP